MNEEVKAARLTGKRLKAMKMLYSLADVHEVFRDEPGQELRNVFCTAFPELATPGQPQPPQNAEVREAVEFFEQSLILQPWLREHRKNIRTLLRAVQAPRLTGERLEAVRVAYYMLEGAGLEGGMRMLRAAFPELAGGTSRPSFLTVANDI